ncbi:MAG: hypothetical protein BJ554DRAFT_1298 [Olpidium bornovanus]|uniref:Uncharacterized protein n=1 Tax=Olpidium bornovanus TaxID=278681 RepID=A0A8H8DHW1_9FUNG|nr:MAG: hypothetical protein BJ554DRAFT_1298 [Olpidium bornovanus]
MFAAAFRPLARAPPAAAAARAFVGTRPAAGAASTSFAGRGGARSYSTQDLLPPNLVPLARQRPAGVVDAADAAAAAGTAAGEAASRLTKESQLRFLVQLYRDMPKGPHPHLDRFPCPARLAPISARTLVYSIVIVTILGYINSGYRREYFFLFLTMF